MPNSSDHGASAPAAFATMSEELHPATADQTRGVRQSLEQIRSLTSDATERLISSILGGSSTATTPARLGLKTFVQQTADLIGEVLVDLENERDAGAVRDHVRTRIADLGAQAGIDVDPRQLDAAHVHDLGQRMGDALTEVMQSLQVEDFVNQLADEILGRLDRLDVLSAEVEDAAKNLVDANPDEMRRFAERLLQLSHAISQLRAEWAGAHKSVSQGQMDEGEIELF